MTWVNNRVIGQKDAERNHVASVRNGSEMVPNPFILDYGSRMTSSIYVRGIGTRIDHPAMGGQERAQHHRAHEPPYGDA